MSKDSIFMEVILITEKRMFTAIFLVRIGSIEDNISRASLVAQWLRVCLLMQGTRVRAWSGRIPHAAEQLGP